ncbi:MAG: tol-pal system-associated acyl-CoA thioesterase [Pseudomonadales bacterium]|nr:tol-pal system-associated acyl-CoA thioesterase [Pseudomonadales bacterium]
MSEFLLSLRVFIEDTDAGGIVYYVNYLKFMERARTEWLRSFGYDFTKLHSMNCVFVVKHAEVNYVSPARMDDLLQVRVTIAKMARTFIVFEQAILRGEQVLCEATIKVGCVSYDSFRPVKIPEAMQQAFLAGS